MPSPKANTARQELIQEVYNLTLMGALRPDVQKHLQDNGTPTTKKQLTALLAAKDKIIAEAVGNLGDSERERLIKEHLVLGRALFARSFAVSDFRTCHSILQSERELLNLNPKKGDAEERTPMTLILNEIVIGNTPHGPAALDRQVASCPESLPRLQSDL